MHLLFLIAKQPYKAPPSATQHETSPRDFLPSQFLIEAFGYGRVRWAW